MKKNTPIRNILILIILLNVGALGVYGVLFYSIKTQTEVSSDLSSTLDQNTARNLRFDEIEKTIKIIEDRAGRLDRYVLEEDNIVVLLSLLEGAAKEKNVIIKTEITSDKVGKSVVLGFAYTITGSWRSVHDFIALIENLPYTSDVNGITIRKVGDGDGGGTWSGFIRFSIVTG